MGSVTPTPITGDLQKASEDNNPDPTSQSEASPPPLHPNKNSPLVGISLAALSAVFVVTSRAVFKYFDEIHVLIMNLYTNIVCTLIALPLTCIFLESEDCVQAKEMKYSIIIQGFLAAMSTITARVALMQLPIGTVTTIFYTRPILVMIAAYFILKEKFGWSRAVCSGCAMIGVVLVVRPPFLYLSDESDIEGPWWAYLLAFVQALFATAYVIYLRITKDVHFVIPVVVSAVFGTISGVVVLPLVDVFVFPTTLLEYTGVLVIGASSSAGGLLFILAHHYCDAGPLSVARTIDLVLSFIIQVLLFHQVPSIISIIGASIVTLSITGIGVSEYLAQRKNKKLVIVVEPIHVMPISKISATSVRTTE